MYVYHARILFRVKVDFIEYKLADIPPDAKKFLNEQAKELVEHSIELNYDYWTSGEQK